MVIGEVFALPACRIGSFGKPMRRSLIMMISIKQFGGFLSGIAISAMALGCGSAPAAEHGDEDPFNIINRVEVDQSGKVVSPHEAIPLPEESIRKERVEDKDVEEEERGREVGKIEPSLRDLAARDPDARVAVLINLEDTIAMPRLPMLEADVRREGEEGQKLMRERSAMIDQLAAARRETRAPIIERLRAQGIEIKVLEEYWIVNAVSAELPARDLEVVAEQPQVLFVQPRFTGDEPPDHDGNSANDTIDGRALINSDPYFNLGLTSGYIGLLDTGIRIPPHVLLDPAIDTPFYRDCVNGGTNCWNTGDPAYDPNDDCWNHGNSSAAIIQGDGSKGAAFRGVTAVTLDSFKVYPQGCGGLDAAAVVRGIQAALAVADSVIVYEMQASESENGTIATAADNAYDAGAINIAANGNFGPASSSVRSPAIAHKVIGVGAYHVQSPTTVNASSGRGPATDGRYKPDVTAPTSTETASTASPTAMKTFSGTSGATPYVGGAAMLLRNWLRRFGTHDNGQVYAQLIEAGQRPWPFSNDEGAGSLELITCAVAWWGKLSISETGTTIDIPLDVSPPRNRGIEAAIWWPERASEAHDDIDLRLFDPTGAQVASSISIPSIFERLQHRRELRPGTWKLQVRGFSVKSGPQTVYWVADARGC